MNGEYNEYGALSQSTLENGWKLQQQVRCMALIDILVSALFGWFEFYYGFLAVFPLIGWFGIGKVWRAGVRGYLVYCACAIFVRYIIFMLLVEHDGSWTELGYGAGIFFAVIYEVYTMLQVWSFYDDICEMPRKYLVMLRKGWVPVRT